MEDTRLPDEMPDYEPKCWNCGGTPEDHEESDFDDEGCCIKQRTTKRVWNICDECDGEGKTVHAALSVWTQDDRAEDPDGFADMMNGMYDVVCPKCNGSGKILEEHAVNFRQRLADARLMGMESGDPELYYNPRLGL